MSERRTARADLPVKVVRPGLFRPESIEARRMVWLGSPAIGFGTPAALLSIASVVMLIAAAALVGFGSYVRRIALHGMVMPSAGLIELSAPASGWVQSMAVRDSAVVKAGAPLYVVNTDSASASGDTQEQILKALAGQRRIVMYQIGRRISLRNQQDAELRERIANLQRQRQQMAAEVTLHEEFLRVATKNYADFARWQQQHIATLNERLGQQSNWMQTKDSLERLKSDGLHVQEQLLEAEAQQANNDLQADNEVDQMRAKIAELDQQVATTQARHSITIRAPGAGTVTAIAIHPGQTVSTGARMLTIIPAKDSMRVELLAPSTAISFIRPGERVLLRYSAFPYQRFGVFAGTVTEVAHAALQPQEIKSLVPELPPADQARTFYRVVVKPERQQVSVSGHFEPLQANIQVDASVLLEKRRLYQLILQPLYDLNGA
jgi:membrane fusion protein